MVLGSKVEHKHGQRNQVYTFLKCLTTAEVLLFKNENGGAKSSTFLKISIHEDEERNRDSRMPFIILDPVLFNYVEFHSQYFQPFLLK